MWDTHVTKGSVNTWTLVTAIATMVGAFGGFPQPPPQFLRLAQYPLVQWLLVFILIYQGGSNQNPFLALALTLATFVVYQVLDWLNKRKAAPKEETIAEQMMTGDGN